MIFNQEPLALSVEMDIKTHKSSSRRNLLKISGGENHWNSAPDMGHWNSLGYRAWIQQGEMQDTNTGDTVVGDGGRKNGTLLSPANIVLLSFHIAKSVNIRREDAIVLESYLLKRATLVSW